MKVRVQQLNPTVGDIEGNSRGILAALEQAEEVGVDLLILPEMCTCGYSPMDLLERPDFLEAVDRANKAIINATDTTALIFGTVTLNHSEPGRPCFNAALMAHNGQRIGEVNKGLLPTYDVFDEERYFERNVSPACIEWNGKKWGITIGRDILGNNNRVRHYNITENPLQELADQGADALINISAFPFTVTKSGEQRRLLREHAENIHRPIFYANQAGGHTSLISEGDSMILNAQAEIVAASPLFEEAFIDAEWNEANEVKAGGGILPMELPPRMERIFQALRQGLHDYMEKTGVTSDVIIGLSGGMDSALAACIAAEALGAEHVMGVMMPSAFSSEGSVRDATQLARNLGIEVQKIPVQTIYDTYLNALEPLFKGTSFGTAEENLQARIRGVLLMAIANKFNRFVLNAGNKSELAVGYCTLYGDTNGALAVISDLYKTEVYELSCWLNESYYGKQVIPQNIFDKPPSAELRPDQKDSDHLPEYDKLDIILKLYIEDQQPVSEIVSRGYERELVKRVIGLVNQNEYKRYQAPPGLEIHRKAFGRGRRMPVVNKWTNNS